MISRLPLSHAARRPRHFFCGRMDWKAAVKGGLWNFLQRRRRMISQGSTRLGYVPSWPVEWPRAFCGSGLEGTSPPDSSDNGRRVENVHQFPNEMLPENHPAVLRSRRGHPSLSGQDVPAHAVPRVTFALLPGLSLAQPPQRARLWQGQAARFPAELLLQMTLMAGKISPAL